MTATAPASAQPATPTAGPTDPRTQLKVASAVAIGFGLLIGLGSHDATDLGLRWFADLLFAPVGDPPVLTREARLLAAILGGVMTSWGVMVWMLTSALAERDPIVLRRIILTTMVVWFVLDGAGSIASGGWLNLIGNTAFLALFVIPALRLDRRTVLA